jgi:hypothetical protein
VWAPVRPGLAPVVARAFTCFGHPGVLPLVLQVPHPFYDRTREEALALFERGRARFLLLSGTHRCAVAALSGCTGARGKVRGSAACAAWPGARACPRVGMCDAR